jgi:hypothetical protein
MASAAPATIVLATGILKTGICAATSHTQKEQEADLGQAVARVTSEREDEIHRWAIVARSAPPRGRWDCHPRRDASAGQGAPGLTR